MRDTVKEKEEEYLIEKIKNSNKLKLINRKDYLIAEGIDFKKFMLFYYLDLEMDIDDALEEFNKQ